MGSGGLGAGLMEAIRFFNDGFASDCWMVVDATVFVALRVHDGCMSRLCVFRWL